MTPSAPAIDATRSPMADAAIVTSGSRRPGTSTSRHTPPTCVVSTAGQATVSPEGRRATMTASSAWSGTSSSTTMGPSIWARTASAWARSATFHTPLPS